MQYMYNQQSVSILQGFPQDKIIAGCSVFVASHMTISGMIFLTTY